MSSFHYNLKEIVNMLCEYTHNLVVIFFSNNSVSFDMRIPNIRLTQTIERRKTIHNKFTEPHENSFFAASGFCVRCCAALVFVSQRLCTN